MTAILTTMLTDLLVAMEYEVSTDSEGAPLLLLLLGPAGAVAVYWGLHRYYRNTDKSHSFEEETRIDARPVEGQDRKVDTVTGTKRTRISGDNVSSHRKRVERLG